MGPHYPRLNIVVDAKSGAGKTPSERRISEVHGSVAAYGAPGHRHGAEIEQGAGREVNLFHPMPLIRILSTICRAPVPGTPESLAVVYE